MSSAAAAAAPEEFPAGLRVLVVDDDVTCLRLLEQMLQRCRYRVTVCCQATLALSLLRERKDCYDVVISDVHMPDMDGYRLLELVGLEMDLPVIMMSADGRTSAVLRGINHGACDYLIKPIRIEELKNIWQHVARKKWQNKEAEHLGNLEDSDRQRRLNDRVDGSKSQKKKRDVKENEDDGELDIEDPSTSKKPRVVWSVELHQQFISAVSQLGIEKAVPKRILELMNVPWLTRENVASHLQKFRQYLKRVAQHPGGVPNFFNDPIESNAAAGSVSRLNFQGLVASGQIPAQTLAALHEELLGQPSGGLLLPTLDKHHLFQTSFQGSKCNPMESDISFGLPLLKCDTEKLNHSPQASIAVENISSGFSDTRGGINSTQNGSLLKMAVLQQQQPDAISVESCHAINIRPSVVLAPRPDSFQINNMSVSLNQNTFGKKSSFTHAGISPGVGERILLSSQYNNMPMSVAGLSDGVLKNVGMLDGSSTPGQLSSPSVSSSGSSRSVFTDINTGSEVLNSTVNFGSASRLAHQPNFCVMGSEAKTGTLPPQGHGRYLGFVGKKTCISSRFAVDDLDASTCNMDDRTTSIGDDGDRLKQGHYATTFFCK